MNTRKSSIPTLISGSSGKPSPTIVQRQSACRCCSTQIGKGTTCYEIPKKAAFKTAWRYCESCFRKILEKTRRDLDALDAIVAKEQIA